MELGTSWHFRLVPEVRDYASRLLTLTPGRADPNLGASWELCLVGTKAKSRRGACTSQLPALLQAQERQMPPCGLSQHLREGEGL